MTMKISSLLLQSAVMLLLMQETLTFVIPQQQNHARSLARSLPPLSYPLSSPLSGPLFVSFGSSYEKLMEKLPSKPVVDSVIEAKNGKVVASDVATRAGVSLSQASKDLAALASLSQGDISVSNDGDLVYEFPSDLNGVLSSNSAKYKALQTFEKIWPRLFWGLRIGFGVSLLVSVVLIFSAIFFIQTSSSDEDDRRSNDRGRSGGGGGFGGGFGGMNIWGPSPFDFFYYRPYGYYGYYGDGESSRDPSEMGFFESVFSYVFGDGNPNAGIEERRLSLAAQMIRKNNGAVTAEQLAPYCDAPMPDDRKAAYVDESFVLPIVTQLDGEPRVTEDGDIVYIFPELQVSTSMSSEQANLPTASTDALILKRAGLSPNASSREIQRLLYLNGIDTTGVLEKKQLIRMVDRAMPPMTQEEKFQMEQQQALSDPSLLQERQYEFSVAPDLYKFFAGALGVVNLGGALYLGGLLGQLSTYSASQLPAYVGFAKAAYPFLLAYAVLFNAIPLVRRFWISRQNDQIAKRNSSRRAWLQVLSARMGDVRRKLQSKTKFDVGQKQIGSNDMIFNTKSDVDEIKANKEKSDMDDFDKLLGDFQ